METQGTSSSAANTFNLLPRHSTMSPRRSSGLKDRPEPANELPSTGKPSKRSTRTAATKTTPIKEPSRLVYLPGEIKLPIYRYALVTDESVNLCPSKPFCHSQYPKTGIGLLLVNKEVNSDSTRIFYTEAGSPPERLLHLLY